MSQPDTAVRPRPGPPAARVFSSLATLRSRIVAGFALLVIITALGAAGSAWEMHTHRSEMAEMQAGTATVSLLQGAEGETAIAVAQLQGYITTGDERTIPGIRTNLATAKAKLLDAEAEEHALGHQEDAATFGQFLAAIGVTSDMAEQAISLRQRGDVQGASTAIALGAPSLLPAQLEYDRFVAGETQQLADLRGNANQTGDIAFWFAVLGGAAGAILAAAAAVLVARSILRPLSRLESAALAVAGGDLAARAPETGPRELARVGASFNQMTESLVELNRSLEDQVRERTRELRDSEERYRLLVESSPHGVLVHVDGKIVFVNDAALKIVGAETREQLIGRSLLEFAHPEYLSRVRRRVHLSTELGIVPREEVKLMRLDGTPVDVQSSGARLMYEGKPATLLVVQDITERKRADEALMESEQRYRLLVDSMSEGLVVQDENGLVTYVNDTACRMFGYNREEFLGRLITDIVHEDSLPEFERNMTERRQGRGTTYELTFTSVEGGKFIATVSGNPLAGPAGEYCGAFAVLTDITDRKRAEEALAESAERYRRLVESSPDGVIVHIDGKIVFANDAALNIIGAESREQLIGRSMLEFAHPEYQSHVRRLVRQSMQTGVPPQQELKLIRQDGEPVDVEASGARLTYEGKPAIQLIVRDITARKRAEETIRHMAYHDSLTGLPNRALFEDRFSVALAQARRAGHSLCLMSVDVDHFKLVNDTLGHAAGDAVLKAAGERLKGLVREGDTVARVGGDEFVLLLPGDVSAADASRVAADILSAFRKPFPLDGQEVRATISIGISFYPHDGDTADALIRNADAALYRAKDMGRSNYQLYTPSMNIGAAERLALDRELRHALEHEEFDIYYQPQLAIVTGEVVGAEALLRWRHPIRGVVAPAEFIPLAEETGLIVPLGEWVLRTTCVQAQVWQAAGLPPLRVAVNISMRQFHEPGLVQTVTQVLKDTELDPTWLELEITESTAMRDAAFTISVLRQLREMGVRISIDDFGTGHSSLRYLRDFPIHALKIDRSFVRDITTDPNDAALVAEVITLSHRLGLEVVAEGVETREQLDFMLDKGCDLFQGYLCARPMPAGAFEEFLQSGASPCGKLFTKPRSKNGARSSRATRATAQTGRGG